MPKDIHSTAPLNDGHQIPTLGLGTWLLKDDECIQAVSFALNNGYDLIDTAQAYGNEAQVGQGWVQSGRSRESFHLTTKIRNMFQGTKSSRESLERSLKALQTDYVDLLLIHWPDVDHFSLTAETWLEMIEMQKEGLARSIGVSNFTPALMDKLIEQSDVIPAVNQVEFHTFLYQKDLVEYCGERDILLEAYSPIARAKYLDDPTLTKVAEKHGKTTAQVMLAWLVQHGIAAIPKSVHEKRILENADIFFGLDDADMQTLDGLNRNERLIMSKWSPPSWTA
jgi:diketogulonate reductase-like aldo/keto reductase